MEQLAHVWGLKHSSAVAAIRGAENLGLVQGGEATLEGEAYDAILTSLGFDLARDRDLTKHRLVDWAPPYAAVLKAVLLRNPAISFIADVLRGSGGGPLTAVELAERGHVVDAGMAAGVFGAPSDTLQAAEIRPSTRFNLKAGLYDVGILQRD